MALGSYGPATAEPKADIMAKSSAGATAPKPKYRKMNQFEREERDQQFLEWHYVQSWPCRVIQMLHEREQSEIAKRGGLRLRPITIRGVQDIVSRNLRRQANLEILETREATIRAKMRYEHIFQHVLSMLRRQAKPAVIDPTTNQMLAPPVSVMDDKEAISAARVAIQVQHSLDRVCGVQSALSEDGSKLDEGDPVNPLTLFQTLLKAFDHDAGTQATLRDLFRDAVKTKIHTGDLADRKAANGGKRQKPVRRGG